VEPEDFAMPKFIIEREWPGASKMTDAELREASLQSLEVLKKLGPGIRWIHSYVTDDKFYCIYYSPDEATIREHGRILGVPVSRVAAVRRLIDPSGFE
jgi:hypothetical protein